MVCLFLVFNTNWGDARYEGQGALCRWNTHGTIININNFFFLLLLLFFGGFNAMWRGANNSDVLTDPQKKQKNKKQNIINIKQILFEK